MTLQHSLSKPMQAAWQSELYCTRKPPATNGQLHILVEKYVPEKENAFADFLSRKYDVDQPDNNKTTTSNQAKTTDIVNVVETRVWKNFETTFNCTVSTIYTPIQVVDNMVTEIIQQL
uniref:Uncharacterized protein n=1 Tax=Romanomermis culicivorax TaxID=13658 RepID=A0A915LB48_ROMCU